LKKGIEIRLLLGGVGRCRFISGIEKRDGFRGEGGGGPFFEFGIKSFVCLIFLDHQGKFIRVYTKVNQEELVHGAIVIVFSEGSGVMGLGLVDHAFQMVDSMKAVHRTPRIGISKVHRLISFLNQITICQSSRFFPQKLENGIKAGRLAA
jgi:hypothetical protein